MTKPKPTGKTLADFRAAHDPNVIVPARIKKALAEMRAENRENWLYEGEFLKRANVSALHASSFREEFAAHIVETRGHNAKRVWFADTKVAAQARGEPNE